MKIKNLITVIILLFGIQISKAQNSSKIDSINNIETNELNELNTK